MRERAKKLVSDLQDQIIAGLEQLDGTGTFGRDPWERPGGGGGLTRVIADGDLIEKGGVNVSAVHGELSEAFAGSLPGSGRTFFATGVSLVIHPRSPHIPTVHANFRFIEHGDKSWCGGGADLTPYYFHAADKQHFHDVWRSACDRHPDVADYERFASWCDRYFYLPHRGERRGVGGIFFDYVPASDAALDFLADAGGSFLEAYVPLAEKHRATPVTPAEREWQLHRRGRYVEFNLIHDRGTTFGLKTGGRTESILMSLPPLVKWSYAHEPAPGTPEARLLAEVTQPPGPPPAEDPRAGL